MSKGRKSSAAESYAQILALGRGKETIPKQESGIEKEKGAKAIATQEDGQHRNVINCGCRRCNKVAADLKQEVLKLDKNTSSNSENKWRNIKYRNTLIGCVHTK